MSNPCERRQQFIEDYKSGNLTFFPVPQSFYTILFVMENRETYSLNIDTLTAENMSIGEFLDYFANHYGIIKNEYSVCEINKFVYNTNQAIKDVLKIDYPNVIRFYLISI